MKRRLVFSSLLLLALSLAVVPTAMASNTWYVDGVNGSDKNNCKTAQTACKTIGHAISLAHSGDSIRVAAATYTENLSIGFGLKIVGSSKFTTIIDGGGVNTVVTISNANAHVALSKVTIRNGSASGGGGINNSGTLTVIHSTLSGNGAIAGGGILNVGTLMVIDSTLSGNKAQTRVCTGCGARGGGIENEGALTISNSTLSGNDTVSRCDSECFSFGGGISNSGLASIKKSTISGNSVARDLFQCKNVCFVAGGGIANFGTLTINNSTLSGNKGAGGIDSYSTLTINNSTLSGNKGGIDNCCGGTTILQNTIVANSLYGNCGGTMTSNGYNLSSDNTCNFNNTGDLNNTEPKLGGLRNNGGPTQTHALLSGSPAIDAGNPNGCTDGQGHLLKTDQRGKPRPDKEDTGGCDMGAYERQKD